ncbi:ATP-dependent RNA helicase DRS1, partial [Aspergillus sclerotialis]
MAPAKDEDFVLTLSDDENPIEDEEGDEGTEADPASKKRKRDTAEAQKGKNKKLKPRQQTKNGKTKNKKGKAEPEPDSEEEDSEDDTAMDGAENDGALNPEFEFEFGTAANQGVTEGFDGWGIDENKEVNGNGNKKAVDIDEIISRRQAKKEADAKKKGKKSRDVESE